MTTKVQVLLDAGLRFSAATQSGFTITTDSPGPTDSASAASPMELVLVALGGCTAMDVISILRKMRQEVTYYNVALSGERATEHPRVYTSIIMTHTFHGTGITEASVRRAIELSMTKYCPVFGMLSPNVAIEERFEIVEEETGAAVNGRVSPPAGTSTE